jgi:regulator of RNase E activity RraA
VSLIDRLRALDTCAVSDALDNLGLPDRAALGLAPLWPARGTVAGRARTIRVAPRTGQQPGAHFATGVVDSARPGDVVVIANGGRTDVSCWGGILTAAARRNGVAGVIIDGACRDIADSEAQELPVFGRAVVPVSARGRIVQEAADVPVTVAGVAVGPGDYVIADASGVVILPADDAERIVELAERIAAHEAVVVAAVRDGRPVGEAMDDRRVPR